MRKLTVVHVVYSLEVGGLENGLVNLINQLDSERFAHVICCLSRSGALAARIEQENVIIHEMGLDMTRFRFPLLRLARLFRHFKPDIVHTRGWSAVDGIFAAKLALVAGIIHGEHGRDAADPEGRNVKRNVIRRALSPLVDRFITVSDDLRFWLTGTVGISQKKVVTIHNGVDIQKFAPLSARSAVSAHPPSGIFALRNALGLPSEGLLIGTVGRLDPVKDHKSLLRAFAPLAHGAEPARLIIVGDGPMRGEIESEIRKLQIDECVHLLGERQDVAKVLKALDVFALTSVAEGISNTILEAMACGLPVVATRVGGNPELVQDDVTGRLAPAQDVPALSAILLDYVKNANLRWSHGTAARQRAVEMFSLSQMALSYERNYFEVARR